MCKKAFKVVDFFVSRSSLSPSSFQNSQYYYYKKTKKEIHYTTLKNYYSIALFNTLDKVMKFIMRKNILYLVKTY